MVGGRREKRREEIEVGDMVSEAVGRLEYPARVIVKLNSEFSSITYITRNKEN